MTPPNDYYSREINIKTEYNVRTAMMTGNQIAETQVKDLFIFRTDIAKRTDFLSVKYDLEKLHGIYTCTIDLEDCDKVLRVECENVSINKVVEEVSRHNFFCQELED